MVIAYEPIWAKEANLKLAKKGQRQEFRFVCRDIFDCLNDLRNLQEAVNATNKFKAQEGRGEAQVALAYTLGDAYTLEYWTSMAKKIEEMGADSICIKDMAGLLVPYKAAELIKAMKEVTKLPIQLHTHYTSGVASMTYLKAVEAGVDVIDTAMSPFAMGTSQPATEVMVETFKGTPYDTGLDQNLLAGCKIPIGEGAHGRAMDRHQTPALLPSGGSCLQHRKYSEYATG